MVSYNTFMADKNCSMCNGEGYIGLRYQQYPCSCVKATELKMTEKITVDDGQRFLKDLEQFITAAPDHAKAMYEYLNNRNKTAIENIPSISQKGPLDLNNIFKNSAFIRSSSSSERNQAFQELYDKIFKSQVPSDPELDQIISSNIKEISKHGFTEPDKNCDICGGSGFLDNGTYNCVCTDAFKPITSTSDPKFK